MSGISLRRNLRAVCSEVLLLLVSSFVYALAFPGFVTKTGIGFIAFFALIPVFMVIRRTSWKLIPWYGFFYGFMFYLFFNYWLKSFHPLAILIVPIIKGGEMLLLFPCLKAADRWFPKRGFLVQAIIWTAYTYLSQSWFAGYPYGTIAYAIWQYRPLIQTASLWGIWGINFLMILPQAFFAVPLADHTSVKEWLGERKPTMIIYAAVIVFCLVFGFVSMVHWDDAKPNRTWRVATVQHNANSWLGGYTTYKRNFNNLRKMSLEALEQKPQMIIWSETAFVPSVAWHEKYPSDPDTSALVEEFTDFGKSLPVPLLTGNPEGVLDDPSKPAISEDGSWNRKDYNTVILFEDGAIKETYRKQHLVPFTEHFPYQKQMPHLYNLLKANDYHWWEKGTDPVVFRTTDGLTFSTPICFEDVFGDLCARFIREGADMLVNMTNDNWSQSVAAEMQHMAMAVFRSVENRRTTVRGTNSGMTCVITPAGKVVDPMTPFKAGWHIYDVPVYQSATHSQTWYTTWGDLVAKLFVGLSITLLCIGAVEAMCSRRRH